jgi:hypothetical protein
MIATVLQFLPGRPLAPVIPLGQARTARCEGRCCPDRSSPVFVVGALLLCGACRDYRNQRIRFALRQLALDGPGRIA